MCMKQEPESGSLVSRLSRSLEVINAGTFRSDIYDFLLIIRSNRLVPLPTYAAILVAERKFSVTICI